MMLGYHQEDIKIQSQSKFALELYLAVSIDFLLFRHEMSKDYEDQQTE